MYSHGFMNINLKIVVRSLEILESAIKNGIPMEKYKEWSVLARQEGYHHISDEWEGE